MQSKATTVAKYLAELPAERRRVIKAVRNVILKHLPKGYEEGMQYGMIGYFVSHSVYPSGYHCDPQQPLPFATPAPQKNNMSVYPMCIYGNAEHDAWFRQAWKATGKKLNMGKSCVRFKKLDDIPLKIIGQAIRRVPVKKFIAHYEAAINDAGRKHAGKRTAKKTAKKKKK